MDVSGISSSLQTYDGSQTTSSNELGKDAFMSLLVTQMKNQDPLTPMNNEEFIAQLAQFSSLEQMQTMNENILGLAILQQGNALLSQLTSSSALIGRTVNYVDPDTGVARTGTVSSVKIEDGSAFLHVAGEDIPLANVTEITSGESASGSGTEGDGSEGA